MSKLELHFATGHHRKCNLSDWDDKQDGNKLNYCWCDNQTSTKSSFNVGVLMHWKMLWVGVHNHHLFESTLSPFVIENDHPKVLFGLLMIQYCLAPYSPPHSLLPIGNEIREYTNCKLHFCYAFHIAELTRFTHNIEFYYRLSTALEVLLQVLSRSLSLHRVWLDKFLTLKNTENYKRDERKM